MTLRRFSAVRSALNALADRRSGLGRQQRNDPTANSGTATAGANDRHAAQL